MIEELTLQAYYELVQAEGLLGKSLGADTLVAHCQPARSQRDEAHRRSLIKAMYDEDQTVFPLVLATADKDRGGDVLNIQGVDYKGFKLNPLFLWEHAKAAPLEESILGKFVEIRITPEALIATAKYMPTSERSKQILALEQKGLIPANSIGWRPLGDITIDRATGTRYIGKWELLEGSKVGIPMNAATARTTV